MNQVNWAIRVGQYRASITPVSRQYHASIAILARYWPTLIAQFTDFFCIVHVEILWWHEDGRGTNGVKRCSGHKTYISNRFSDLKYMSLEYQHTKIRLFSDFPTL